jgi:hypothetical protein
VNALQTLVHCRNVAFVLADCVALLGLVSAMMAGDSPPVPQSAAVGEKRAESGVAPPAVDGGKNPSSAPAREPSRPAPVIPHELQPYQVEIRVGFESDPRFDDEFRQSVFDGVREGLERYVGNLWRSTIVEERGRIFAGLAALRRLRVEDLPKDAAAGEVQKVYFLSVRSSGPGYRLAGREWDVITRQLGELAVRSVSGSGEISEGLLAVLREVFRPLAAVEISKSGTATLRARGGEFPPRDPAWLPLQAGRTFEIYYCFLNKDRAIERVQQVPFTYLTAGDETSRGVAAGMLASGLRAPLTARRRIQVLALGITHRRPETQLTLVTRPPARKPLGGVEVEVSSDRLTPEERRKTAEQNDSRTAGDQNGQAAEKGDGNKVLEKQTPAPAPEKRPRFVADRGGVVHLTASLAPSGNPVWLFVRSGQVLLARVPIVPGAQSSEVLELPDDTLRLEIEGSVSTLQAELVDAVARRAVLMAVARARAKAGQWEAMSEALKQLDEMPKAASFAANINAIRQPALKAARARRDRTTEERVKKLCDEALELVTNYLDEEKLKELKDEVNEMRQIAADEAAAEAKTKAGGDARGEPEPAGGGKSKKKKASAPRAAPPTAKPAPGF